MAKKLFVMVAMVVLAALLSACGVVKDKNGNECVGQMTGCAYGAYLSRNDSSEVKPEAKASDINAVRYADRTEFASVCDQADVVKVSNAKGTQPVCKSSITACEGKGKGWGFSINDAGRAVCVNTQQANKQDSAALAVSLLALQLAAFIKRGGRVSNAMRIRLEGIVWSYSQMAWWTDCAADTEEISPMSTQTIEHQLNVAIRHEEEVINDCDHMRIYMR
jgi:hypothetical protein